MWHPSSNESPLASYVCILEIISSLVRDLSLSLHQGSDCHTGKTKWMKNKRSSYFFWKWRNLRIFPDTIYYVSFRNLQKVYLRLSMAICQVNYRIFWWRIRTSPLCTWTSRMKQQIKYVDPFGPRGGPSGSNRYWKWHDIHRDWASADNNTLPDTHCSWDCR